MAKKGSSNTSRSRATATNSRSARTGRFVTKSYASKHKSTTVTEKNKRA